MAQNGTNPGICHDSAAFFLADVLGYEVGAQVPNGDWGLISKLIFPKELGVSFESQFNRIALTPVVLDLSQPGKQADRQCAGGASIDTLRLNGRSESRCLNLSCPVYWNYALRHDIGCNTTCGTGRSHPS